MHSVFYFACTKIMEDRPPTIVLFQIVGHVPGKQDVSGITAIHYPLGMLIPAPAMLDR